MKGRVRGDSNVLGLRIVSHGTNALSQHKRHITKWVDTTRAGVQWLANVLVARGSPFQKP